MAPNTLPTTRGTVIDWEHMEVHISNFYFVDQRNSSLAASSSLFLYIDISALTDEEIHCRIKYGCGNNGELAVSEITDLDGETLQTAITPVSHSYLAESDLTSENIKFFTSISAGGGTPVYAERFGDFSFGGSGGNSVGGEGSNVQEFKLEKTASNTGLWRIQYTNLGAGTAPTTLILDFYRFAD